MSKLDFQPAEGVGDGIPESLLLEQEGADMAARHPSDLRPRPVRSHLLDALPCHIGVLLGAHKYGRTWLLGAAITPTAFSEQEKSRVRRGMHGSQAITLSPGILAIRKFMDSAFHNAPDDTHMIVMSHLHSPYLIACHSRSAQHQD